MFASAAAILSVATPADRYGGFFGAVTKFREEPMRCFKLCERGSKKVRDVLGRFSDPLFAPVRAICRANSEQILSEFRFRAYSGKFRSSTPNPSINLLFCVTNFFDG